MEKITPEAIKAEWAGQYWSTPLLDFDIDFSYDRGGRGETSYGRGIAYGREISDDCEIS